MHPCTGPGCSVCSDSMAGEELARVTAERDAWTELARARGALLIADGLESDCLLEEREIAAEDALVALGVAREALS